MSPTAAGSAHATVAAHGLRVTLPARWEARLYLRDDPAGVAGPFATHPAAYGHPDASTNPVLHLANFALPPGRGDFGTGAVERMGPGHAFACLLEYDAVEAGTALFAEQGVPRPALTDFAPNQLQRRLPGQLGRQSFFTERGRPFCLYVVLGSRAQAAELLGQVHVVLGTLEVSDRWPVQL